MKYSIELGGKIIKTVEADSIAHVCADTEAQHPDLTDPKGEEFSIDNNDSENETAANGYYFIERA